MKIFYKATRLDGTSFHDRHTRWEVGRTVDVGPAARKLPAECCDRSVLHASTSPADTLIGGEWPCRLFEVTGRVVAEEENKRGFRQLRVVREVESWRALGPQGQQVAALIDRAKTATKDEVRALGAAWDAARDAAWDAARGAARDAARGAARDAAWGAARDAAWGAAWDAARGAAWALVVRELISPEHYDTLTMPWRQAVGSIHPDDPR